MRLAQYLTENRVSFETLMHPPAFTAQKRAKYLGLSGRQVAKSVLLRGPDGYCLAVLPAHRRVDLDLLSQHLGGPVRLATTGEMAQVFLDCEWGVAAPFGTQYGLPTYLDEALPANTTVVLELQSQFEAIRMCCRDFEKLEKARRLPISRA